VNEPLVCRSTCVIIYCCIIVYICFLYGSLVYLYFSEKFYVCTTLSTCVSINLNIHVCKFLVDLFSYNDIFPQGYKLKRVNNNSVDDISLFLLKSEGRNIIK
jgi:hypothetical protein